MKLLKALSFLLLILVSFFLVTQLTLVKTSDAQTYYRVKGYIIVPSDYDLSNSDRSRYESGIIAGLQKVRDFYSSKLNGKTFNIEPTVQVINSSQPLSGIHGSLISALNRLAPELNDPVNGLVRVNFVLGTDTTFNYYHGTTSRPAFGGPRGSNAGITYGDQQMLDRIVAQQNWGIYVLAHELGHAFGLVNDGYTRWHTCWTQYQDQECTNDAPLPLPEGDESSNSIMSYNETYGALGLNVGFLSGFVNTIHNPEIKKLYQSPFINPSGALAPEPAQPVYRHTTFNPEDNGLNLEGTVISNNENFTKENINGAQGSRSVYVKANAGKTIDWTPDPTKSQRAIYIKEVYSDNSVKINTMDVTGKETVDINNVRLNIQGGGKIITKIFIAGEEYNLGRLSDIGAYVYFLDNRLVPVSVEYSDGTTKVFALDFSLIGDNQCLENKYYCKMKDEGELVRIHYGNGVYNGDQCVYADVEAGNCSYENNNPLRMGGFCPTSNSYTLFFKPIENAQNYLIRVDQDPSSWSGGNTNGDIVDDSPNLEWNESNKEWLYKKEGVGTDKSYEWWIHGINDQGVVSDPVRGHQFSCTEKGTQNCEAGLCPITFYESRSQNGQLRFRWDDYFPNRKASKYAIRLDKNPDSFDPFRLDSDEVLDDNYQSKTFVRNCEAGKTYKFWVHPITSDGRFGDPYENRLTCQGAGSCNAGGYRRECTGRCVNGTCGEARIFQCASDGLGEEEKSPECRDECKQYCGGGTNNYSCPGGVTCDGTVDGTPGQVVCSPNGNNYRCNPVGWQYAGSKCSCSAPTPGPSVDTRCQYSEHCNNTGTRSCTGTLENGVCKYNPSVSPNCGACSVGSGPAEGSSCTYSEHCTKDDGGGGARACSGTIQGGQCRYAGGSAEDICNQCQ